ncbi:hypothetical protein [Stigmatella aurantiaca]|uniref:Uncharacterized protein n=1 Tax=Stigmatella aurantiaca (strain DW4/3-1) TaxID=378806 RepID=Q08ZU3_STIAD|nr:hypothetical protein [Stigmatella aurantiaca]ADO74792.1 uncharacterized protein STAUR_7036 [Stigmatella aurantiaca DW4/3-1]EAU65994.1 hypothetical protein STIAU_8450 [Stigmatella aurantiaca DW4/3-1]
MKIKGFSSPSLRGGPSDSPRSLDNTRPSSQLPNPSAPSSRPLGQSPFGGGSSFTPARQPLVNPHLANPQLAQSMRPQISQQAQSNPSFYGRLVGGVNGALQQSGFGISPASHQSVMNNLQQVSSGNMSQGTAHFNEASSFAQDAVQSFRHGRPLQGAVEAFGAGLNTVGGTGMSLLQGLGSSSLSRPTPPELNGNDPW